MVISAEYPFFDKWADESFADMVRKVKEGGYCIRMMVLNRGESMCGGVGVWNVRLVDLIVFFYLSLSLYVYMWLLLLMFILNHVAPLLVCEVGKHINYICPEPDTVCYQPDLYFEWSLIPVDLRSGKQFSKRLWGHRCRFCSTFIVRYQFEFTLPTTTTTTTKKCTKCYDRVIVGRHSKCRNAVCSSPTSLHCPRQWSGTSAPTHDQPTTPHGIVYPFRKGLIDVELEDLCCCWQQQQKKKWFRWSTHPHRTERVPLRQLPACMGQYIIHQAFIFFCNDKRFD